MSVMTWIYPKTKEGKLIKSPCTPHNHEFEVSSSQQKLRSLPRATHIEKARHRLNHKQLIDGTDTIKPLPDNTAAPSTGQTILNWMNLICLTCATNYHSRVCRLPLLTIVSKWKTLSYLTITLNYLPATVSPLLPTTIEIPPGNLLQQKLHSLHNWAPAHKSRSINASMAQMKTNYHQTTLQPYILTIFN